MTDKQRTAEFLYSLNIEYIDEPNQHRNLIQWADINSIITLRSGMKSVIGYSHSIAQFYFDDADNFIQVGVWEE